MKALRLVAVLLFSLPLCLGAARAGDLPAPDGQVLLTVTGRIAVTNAPDAADFDRALLESIGLSTLTTSTAWTDGVSTFGGVRLCDLLAWVGATGSRIHARALNEYSVEIPADECQRYPVLLALTRDGRDLARRDKGPIWIVYPRDDYPELRTETQDSRWIWQLRWLEVQ